MRLDPERRALVRDGFPMEDASREDLALQLEEEKQEVRAALDAVTKALLNEDEPLKGEDVAKLGDAGFVITGLSRTLSTRVEDEHRVESE